MKNKSSLIKLTALFLAVIIMAFSFTACKSRPEPPEKDAFELVMDFAQTTLAVGETTDFRVFLKNNEHETYALEHADKLIHIYVVKPENYMDPESHMALSDSAISTSNIAPHGQAEEFYKFTPDEKGTYVLKAYSSFTIEGKESTKSYFYECEKITITVV